MRDYITVFNLNQIVALKLFHVQVSLVLVAYYKQLHVERMYIIQLLFTPNSFQSLFLCCFGVIGCHTRNQKFVVFILFPFKLGSKMCCAQTFVFLEPGYFKLVVIEQQPAHTCQKNKACQRYLLIRRKD